MVVDACIHQGKDEEVYVDMQRDSGGKSKASENVWAHGYMLNQHTSIQTVFSNTKSVRPHTSTRHVTSNRASNNAPLFQNLLASDNAFPTSSMRIVSHGEETDSRK